MMRITEVISDTNIGGAGRLLLARLSYTDRTRFQTTVVLPRGSELKDPLLAQNVPVVETRGGADASFSPSAIPELIRIIKALRPTLIHTHGSLNARIAARICAVPVSLYTRHCVYPLTVIEAAPITRWCQRILCDLLSDHVIAVSPSALENLLALGIPRQKISVIMNGSLPPKKLSASERAVLKKRLRIPADAVVVGICARLEPCKDHGCFLRAACRLARDEKEKYRFLIVGDGSLKSQLKKRSQELGIAPITLFTGFLSDPAPIMNLFDINVNCSVGTETSSLALSEGMSLGIPSVVSNYGGNIYMVQNGVNGFQYPKGDDFALAERIRAIAEHDRLASDMALHAKQRFERELNAEVMTKQYEALYLSLLRARFSRPL